MPKPLSCWETSGNKQGRVMVGREVGDNSISKVNREGKGACRVGRFEHKPKGIVLLCRTPQGKEAGGTHCIPGSGRVCPSSDPEPCGEQKRPTGLCAQGLATVCWHSSQPISCTAGRKQGKKYSCHPQKRGVLTGPKLVPWLELWLGELDCFWLTPGMTLQWAGERNLWLSRALCPWQNKDFIKSSLSTSGEQREQRGSQREATAARPACGPLTPRLAMSPSLADWASTAPWSAGTQTGAAHCRLHVHLPLQSASQHLSCIETRTRAVCSSGLPWGCFSPQVWHGRDLGRSEEFVWSFYRAKDAPFCMSFQGHCTCDIAVGSSSVPTVFPHQHKPWCLISALSWTGFRAFPPITDYRGEMGECGRQPFFFCVSALLGSTELLHPPG